jgi:hypothetical protein
MPVHSIAGASLRRDVKLMARIMVAGTIAVTIGCEADVKVRDSQSNCYVMRNQEAKDAGFNFIHSIPSHCPIEVPASGGRNQDYAGVMKVPKGAQAGALTTYFVDAIGELITNFSAPFEDDVSNDSLRANMSGVYLAGRRGVRYGSGEPANKDYAQNQVLVRATQRNATAQVDITYEAERLAMYGPLESYNDEPFTLTTAILAPGAVSPLRYEWFENDVSLGPSSPDASTLTALRYSGSYQYRVVATDANGATEMGMHQVLVRDRPTCPNPPCNDQ